MVDDVNMYRLSYPAKYKNQTQFPMQGFGFEVPRTLQGRHGMAGLAAIF